MPGAILSDCGDDDTATSQPAQSHPGHILHTAVPTALPLQVGKDGDSGGKILDDTAVLSAISRNDRGLGRHTPLCMIGNPCCVAAHKAFRRDRL